MFDNFSSLFTLILLHKEVSSMSKQRNTNKRVMVDSTSIYSCQEKECLRLHASSSKMLNKIINTDIELKKNIYVIIVEHHGLSITCVMYDSLERTIVTLNDIFLIFIKNHLLHCQRELQLSKKEQLQKSIVVMIIIQAHLV